MTRDGRLEQAVDPSRGNGGWFTMRPASTEHRLILNYDPALCCSVGVGLSQDSSELPPTLAARGVNIFEWSDAMLRLQREVQARQWSTCACVSVGLTVVGLPWVCYFEHKYQQAARKWLDDLNREVGCARATTIPPRPAGALALVPKRLKLSMCALAPQVLVPKGMLAKFQTNQHTQSTGNSSYSEEISWLAVALTPVEAEALRDEPIFWSPGCCTPTIEPHDCQCCFCCCCSPRVV